MTGRQAAAHVRALVSDGLRVMQRDRSLIGMAETLRGAVALEPGGPSRWFGRFGELPVYPRLAALDILDYSEQTLWSGGPRRPSVQRRTLIGEASRLDGVADGAYDALLASHVLEHLANPLGALAEWQRVVRPGGHVLLVMPHRDGTFDHRRPVTSLEHLREDSEQETGEDDMTHLAEILELHDLERDPGAASRESFEARCRDNASIRAMHHHVFDSRSTTLMCAAAGLDVVAMRPKQPYNIFCLCRVGGGAGLDEDELSRIFAESPFPSDRAEA
jgi:SAM-dependent methyltransferase